MHRPTHHTAVLTSSGILILVALGFAVSALSGPAVSTTPQSQTFSRVTTDSQALEVVDSARTELNSQALEESSAAKRELPPLPEGASYPDRTHVSDLDDTQADLDAGRLTAQEAVAESQVVYEDGYFASLTAIDWQCSWISQAVASQDTGDEAGVARAIQVLTDFGASDLAAPFVDWNSYILPEIIEPIATGDSDLALNYLDHSCFPQTRVDLE
ncbi:hypothetical protein [Actinomyces polynesiensis]|uniref:hypothetical protein n=1 Tax=Actinomyces polynesiensis TaxID=1325934 RepID=UPI0005BE6559|nr:hypothetical protein [Actinomyces polynesiensis]